MEHEEMLKGLRSTDDILLADLYEALDDELSKPKSKRNYKDIIELSRAICDLKGIEVTDEELEIGKTKILSKTKINTPVKKKIIRVISSLAACTVVAFFINMFTVNAFNVSIFPKLYERYDNSIVVYFDQERLATEDKLYFIMNKCQEYGINEFVPHYLPNGYSLEILNEEKNYLRFSLNHDNIRINISYMFNTKHKSLSIPSDEGYFYEENINGTIFTISTEDNQYRAVANTENIIFIFTSYELDYAEAEKIIRSLT